MEIEYLLHFLSINTYIEPSLGINTLFYSSYGNRVLTAFLSMNTYIEPSLGINNLFKFLVSKNKIPIKVNKITAVDDIQLI